MTLSDTIYAAGRKPRAILRYEGADLPLGGLARRVLYTVLTTALALRLVAMWLVPFIDTTEARYGEIARKMVETGNWITPQFDYGVPFWGKPPLHTWLSAAGMEMFGINEFAARLPILFCALAVLALVYTLVRQVIGRNAALLSTAVLAISGLFFGASAFVMTDMPMVLGTTLTMVGVWLGICQPQPDRRWGLALFVGVAIGLLAKGPVSLVISVLPLLAWLSVTGKWHVLRRLPWISGLALASALTLPWYIAAERATPGFLNYFLIGEHVQRFLVPGWNGDLYGTGHSEPKGMIWLFFLAAILPWSLWLVPLLLRPNQSLRTLTRDRSGLMGYLLAWSVAPLVLFTPAANILPAYTLPGLPAAAILLVLLWGAPTTPQRGRWRSVAFAGSTLAMIALFVAIVGLTALTPGSTRIKSHKGIVAAAHRIDPQMPFFVLGGRSYSAEFYTAGAARPVLAEDLASLAGPAAISVPRGYEQVMDGLPFTRIGDFGRQILFVATESK